MVFEFYVFWILDHGFGNEGAAVLKYEKSCFGGLTTLVSNAAGHNSILSKIEDCGSTQNNKLLRAMVFKFYVFWVLDHGFGNEGAAVPKYEKSGFGGLTTVVSTAVGQHLILSTFEDCGSTQDNKLLRTMVFKFYVFWVVDHGYWTKALHFQSMKNLVLEDWPPLCQQP